MPSPAQTERAALCDLFTEVGPDAPTLCGDWTTLDLAAHLVVRERSPIGAMGIVVPAFEGLTDRAMDRRRGAGFDHLVASIRSGPPIIMRPTDSLFNTIEYFVHHEDVRRGDNTGDPRAGIDDVHEALWGLLKRGAGLMTRSMKGTTLELARPDGDTIVARRGDDTVRITGSPGEIVLYLYGRKAVADVELDGDAGAIEKLGAADLGI
jgi:uncharacterized protein (TIGR03085 family)